MPSEPTTPLRYVALGDSYTDRHVRRRSRSLAEPARRGPGPGAPRARREPRRQRLDVARRLRAPGPAARDAAPGLRLAPRRRQRRRPGRAGRRPSGTTLPPSSTRSSARCPRDRVLVVSTPDYTVTPSRRRLRRPRRARAPASSRTTTILRALAEERGIAFVDIFDISSEAAVDRSLVARDGLHPSGAQYARWVERIAPVVERLLE